MRGAKDLWLIDFINLKLRATSYDDLESKQSIVRPHRRYEEELNLGDGTTGTGKRSFRRAIVESFDLVF